MSDSDLRFHRFDDVYRKVMTELGWQPRYADIRKTVETAWQWHRTHPDGYGAG